MKAGHVLGLFFLLVAVAAGVVGYQLSLKSSASGSSVKRHVFYPYIAYKGKMGVDGVSNQVDRMIYDTPFEFESDNSYSSRILSSYRFLHESNELQMTLKKGLTYHDGTTITADDLAFSIARLAWRIPQFPVISKILGLKRWLAEKEPLLSLPRGIQVSGQTVTVKFEGVVRQPFFRLSTEFSPLIAKSDYDLKTGEMKTDSPKRSGRYLVQSETKDTIVFELADKKLDLPSEIEFKFRTFTLEDLNAEKDPTVAIAKIFPSSDRFDDLPTSGFEVKRFPTTAHVTMTISGKSSSFSSDCTRRLFASRVRAEFAARIAPRYSMQYSFVPKILSGYLSNDEIKSHLSKFSNDCEQELVGKALHSAPITAPSMYKDVIEAAAESLGMKVTYVTPKPPQTTDELFEVGKIDIFFPTSGYWAADPINDITMIYARNFAKLVSGVWDHERIQFQLRELDQSKEESEQSEIVKKISLLYAETGLINPLFEFEIIYISPRSGVMKDFPMAVHEPFPWQVFDTNVP